MQNLYFDLSFSVAITKTLLLTIFLIFISNNKHISMDISIPLTGSIQLANMSTQEKDQPQPLYQTAIGGWTYLSSCFF